MVKSGFVIYYGMEGFPFRLCDVSSRSIFPLPQTVNFVEIPKPALAFFFGLAETLSGLFYPHHLTTC